MAAIEITQMTMSIRPREILREEYFKTRDI